MGTSLLAESPEGDPYELARAILATQSGSHVQRRRKGSDQMSKEPTWPDDLHDFRESANAPPDAPEMPKVVTDIIDALREGMPHCGHEMQARMLQQHIESDHRLIGQYHRMVCFLLNLAGGRVLIPDS